MNDSYQKFVEGVKINYPKTKDKIFDALEFAIKSHEGVLRRSGDPYIIHPIAVAQIHLKNQHTLGSRHQSIY